MRASARVRHESERVLAASATAARGTATSEATFGATCRLFCVMMTCRVGPEGFLFYFFHVVESHKYIGGPRARRRPHPIITHSHPRLDDVCPLAAHPLSAALCGSGLVARALLRADLFETVLKEFHTPSRRRFRLVRLCVVVA